MNNNTIDSVSTSSSGGRSILQAAFEYHRDGFSVFPIESGTKRPVIIHGKRLSWEPFQGRRPTTEELKRWFSQDNAGIAVVCGQVSGGLIVLDFDGEDWFEAYDRFLEAYPKLAETRKVETGSGKLHLWIRCPKLPGNLTRKVRKFTDIAGEVELRANEHYVLAPPSIHPSGGQYKFCGDNPILELSREELDTIIAWFDESKRRPKPQPEAPSSAKLDFERFTEAANYYLKRAIAEARPGNRNDTGFWLALQLRDLGMSEPEAASYMRQYAAAVPQGDEPYTEDEALASLRSAYKGTPREPAIPGVKVKKEFTPSGREVIERSIEPELTDRLVSYHLTDAGNAEAFRDLFKDQLRWIKERDEWFYWDGVRWIGDNGRAKRTMLEAMRLRAQAAMSIENDEQRAKAVKWCLSSESDFRLRAALSIAQIWLEAKYTDFDTDPYLLACANGVIDLRTGQLRPAKPEDLLHKSTGVRYDPTIRCERWERFLREIFMGDEELVDFIYRAVGYTLTGLMPDFLFICYGTGSNGKSVFLTVLEKLMGEYGISAPASTFKEKRGDMIPNDLARLAGARFCKSVEVKERIVLNEERVKALTGGDRISARFLHREFFDFYPTAKVWWAVNHKPIVRDTTPAMWRRIRLIPFEARFDPELGNWQPKEELLAELEAELPGILAWAVKGCLEWQRRGLEPVEKVKTATEEYRKESDVIERFLEECTIKKLNAKVKASELYQEFKRWAEENGEPGMTGTAFGRRMTEKGFKKRKSMGYTCYQGIGLLSSREG